jgi:hypothetical protein
MGRRRERDSNGRISIDRVTGPIRIERRRILLRSGPRAGGGGREGYSFFGSERGVRGASAKAPQLRVLVGSGVKILADDFALKERGITKLLDGVQIAPIEIVVDHLEAGHKALWH